MSRVAYSCHCRCRFRRFKIIYGDSLGSDTQSLTSLTHVLSAVSAGGFADCVTNPLWVVRTRMQTETLHHLTMSNSSSHKPMTMVETTLHLYKRHGIPVFWRGLTASLLGLSHVAVQFPVYEYLKSYLGDSGPRDWLVASAASKVRYVYMRATRSPTMRVL